NSKKKGPPLRAVSCDCLLLGSLRSGLDSGSGFLGLVVLHDLVGQEDGALVLGGSVLEVAVVGTHASNVNALNLGSLSGSSHEILYVVSHSDTSFLCTLCVFSQSRFSLSIFVITLAGLSARSSANALQ